MKVLVIHSELGVLRGGGENFSRNLFQAFARRGHQIEAAFVADWRGQYPLPLPPEIEPVPIAGWWSSDFGQAKLSSLGRHLASGSGLKSHWNAVQEALAWRTFSWHKRRFQRRVEREFTARWHEFDAIYVHGDTALASAVSRRRPTVLRLPGPVTAERALELRSVHAVCANGDALVRIRAFLGDYAIELPVGLDTEVFTPTGPHVRARLGWSERHRVVGYIGRLAHIKGVDLLASAFREVVQRNPYARLLMIGSGEQESRIRTTLADELAKGTAHLRTDVDHDELPEWYRAMDLFVMPSRYENHSNAILEAMACGVPFLASDVGGNRTLTETGAGSLFARESIPSLVEAMMCLINTREMLDGHKRVCLGHASRPNSWAATAERLETIVARLAQKNVTGEANHNPSVHAVDASHVEPLRTPRS